MNIINWSRKLSIRWKIFIPFFTITLITTIIFTLYGFAQSNKAIIAGIDRRLLIAALTMEQLLPEGYFAMVDNPHSIDPVSHTKNTEKLRQFLEYVDATYLYALYKQDDKYYFVASADPTEPYWGEYRNPAPNIFEIEKNWIVNISTTPDPDFGLLRSAVIPYKDTRGRRFIIGADIHAYEVTALKRRAFLNFVLMGGISFLLSAVFSYLISYTITRPLVTLSAFTRRLTAGGFSSDIRLDPILFPNKEDTHADETALLARDFDRMQQELQAHIIELKQTQSARERAESELRIAGQIQETFLPAPFTPASFDGRVQLAASMKTAKQAGGDLYDYFALDDTHLFLAIGDVSGKGMPAAMFMSVVVVLMRSAAKQTRDPAAIMQRINDDLSERNESCTFVTLFIGILNTRTGAMHFANGGHNPPRLMVGRTIATVPMKGNFVVGAMDGMTFEGESLTLSPGDTLFFYTDGVTEAINPSEAFYGEPRMDDLLAAIPSDSSPADICRLVSEDVITFTGDREQADDITVMSLHFPESPGSDHTAGQSPSE